MERFLSGEVRRKLAAENVRQIPGKVLFSSSAEVSKVCELKAAERLFLLLKLSTPEPLPTQANKAKAASVLQSRLLGEKDQWSGAVMTWRRLQRELERRKAALTRQQEEDRWSEAVERREISGGQNESEVQRVVEPSRPRWTLNKKRKRDDEEEKEEMATAAQDYNSVENGEKKKTPEREIGTGLDLEVSSCGVNGGLSSEEELITPLHSVSDIRTMDGMAEGDAERKATDVEFCEEEAKNPPPPSEPPAEPVSFRISCKCTGALSRHFSLQEVSRLIGVGLSKLLGWRIDLKNPELEVNVNLSDDQCLFGIPLIRLPLANRRYIKNTGLRSTVAWAIGSLAQIKPGFCVVDPMCGVGTILIEAAQEHTAGRFLGVDINDGQLHKASENVEFAELGHRIHLLKASSMTLPLPSASVDAVVCDLPFGRKFGSKTDMAANLPVILAEMERILCSDGTLVLLLSPQLSCLLKKLLPQRDTGMSTNNQEAKAVNDTARQETFQGHQGIDSPPTQKTSRHPGLQQSPTPPLSSLEHQESLRVSLGVIDGLIHKYVKRNR